MSQDKTNLTSNYCSFCGKPYWSTGTGNADVDICKCHNTKEKADCGGCREKDKEIEELKKRVRTIYCVHCGDIVIRYLDTKKTKEELQHILDVSIDHDKTCKENPLVKEIASLQQQLTERENEICLKAGEIKSWEETATAYLRIMRERDKEQW
jgi:hypothetical protein